MIYHKDFAETWPLAQEAAKTWARIIASAAGVSAALEVAERFGGIDGDHHKTWVIDQMVRALTGNGYAAWVAEMKDGADGPSTYEWDEGIAP